MAAATKSVSGRPFFLNHDPIEEWGGLNLYGFCANNAVNHWDYLGNTMTDDEFAAWQAYKGFGNRGNTGQYSDGKGWTTEFWTGDVPGNYASAAARTRMTEIGNSASNRGPVDIQIIEADGSTNVYHYDGVHDISLAPNTAGGSSITLSNGRYGDGVINNNAIDAARNFLPGTYSDLTTTQMAAANAAYGYGQIYGVEFGGWIYKSPDGVYSFTFQSNGMDNEVDTGDRPFGSAAQAFHNHVNLGGPDSFQPAPWDYLASARRGGATDIFIDPNGWVSTYRAGPTDPDSKTFDWSTIQGQIIGHVGKNY